MSAHVQNFMISMPLGCVNAAKARRRVWAPLVLASFVTMLLAGDLFAQAAAKPMKVVHDDMVLTTGDGWEIHVTYFQSNAGKETPVVGLLHREGGNRRVWIAKGGFAERLHNFGYAVIAVDLRKHGQSVSAASAAGGDVTNFDRQRMVRFDMEAVKRFIYKEHMAQRLNMNKTAIIAPEMSAAVAIKYAMVDWRKTPYDDGVGTPRGQDIRALILLSPEKNSKGLSTGKDLRDLGKLAAVTNPYPQFSIFFCYGSKDVLDKRSETKRMHKSVLGPKTEDRVALRPYPFKYRGTDLIGKNNRKTKCEEHMLGFLNDHLKKLTQRPWQDRRSRFDRD